MLFVDDLWGWRFSRGVSAEVAFEVLIFKSRRKVLARDVLPDAAGIACNDSSSVFLRIVSQIFFMMHHAVVGGLTKFTPKMLS